MNSRVLLILLGIALLVLLVQDTEGKSSSEEKKGSSEEKSKKKKKESQEKESEESDEDKKESEEAKPKPKGPFRKVKSCQGQEWEQPNSINKAAKKCLEQRKKDKEEGKKDAKKGPACFAECLWRENDLITGSEEKLKVDQKAVDDFVDEVLVGSLKSGRHALSKEWKACKAEIDADEENDSSCSKFKPYFNCVRTAFRKHCLGSGYKGPHVIMVPSNKGSGLLGLLG